MELIDDRGYLFGLVNIIDALVVLLALAVVVAGVALVTGANTDPNAGTEEATTRGIVFQTNPYPAFVTEAIPEGQIQTEGVVAVREKSILNLTLNQTQPGYNMTRARLRVELVVQTTPDELVQFNGERLYIGRKLRLDFRTTIVKGIVVEIAS